MGPQLYRCGNCFRVRDGQPGSQASMGPQLYRCGNQLGYVQSKKAFSSFNGAATLSLRKPYDSYPACTHVVMLQWGRNFIVAETRTTHRSRSCWERASMGPQLYRCGNCFRVRDGQPGSQASMGPQLYRCGNQLGYVQSKKAFSSFNGAATLSLRKPYDSYPACTHVVMLQWGRNFIVAEIAGKRVLWPASRRGFNGAATLSLRKLDKFRQACEKFLQLQWGRNFIVAEIWTPSGARQSGRTSFNGAATLSLRKSAGLSCSSRTSR